MSDHRSGESRGSHSGRPQSGSNGRRTGGFNDRRRRTTEQHTSNRSGRAERWSAGDRPKDRNNSRGGKFHGSDGRWNDARGGAEGKRPRSGGQERREDWKHSRRPDGQNRRDGSGSAGPGGSNGRWNSNRRGYNDSRNNDERRTPSARRKGDNNRAGFRANRGGSDRQRTNSGPQRPGYREERLNKRLNEISLPADIDPKDLDSSVRQELRSLSKDNADMVAKHLIMAATLLDEDPQKALEHARAAKNRAGRVAVARETCGIAAYHVGEWKEAISELRAARRMSGGPGLLAVLADAERGLGRPAKAIEVAQDEQVDELDAESRVELAIVVAGAYEDLNRGEESLETLRAELDSSDAPEVTRMRLFYAYADALVANGRAKEASDWFRKAAELDSEGLLDTDKRLEELTSQDSAGQEPEES